MNDVTARQRERRWIIVKWLMAILTLNTFGLFAMSIFYVEGAKEFNIYATALSTLLLAGINLWLGAIFKKSVKD